jgi:hypothetical protein
MKRIISFLVSLVLLGTLPFYGQKLSVGVTTGLNLTTFSEPGDLYDNQDIKTGFGGGLSLNLAFGKSFGLQSGLLYEQKGYRRQVDMEQGTEKFTGMYNYAVIPLLFEGSIPVKNNTRLYGVTGAYVGLKTYSENSAEIINSEVLIDDMGAKINKTDAGWVIGGGVQVPAGNHFMQIGIRYSLGLAKVSDNNPDDRNKSLLVGATLFF